MEWKIINNESTFYEIQELSDKERVLLLKYSPECTVSHIMKTLLQREWNTSYMNMKTYLVDINVNKDISEKITQQFGIEHHSPQVLIIKHGKCIHTKSYGHIQFSDLKQYANKS